MHPRPLGLASLTRATLAALLLWPALAFAQDVTEPALKAAFIYNFAKFTEWPGELPPGQPVTMCVLGDAGVADALERAVVGRALGGRPIAVSRVVAASPKRACHVLYVSGVSLTQAGQLIEDLRDLPVLTISDIDGFTQVGGIAQFFFEHGQLRFRIHIEHAKRAKLQISSRILVIAKP
jgi:hypothetical protein